MKLASLIVCLVCWVALKANAQTINPKQTEEYTNLLKIIDAYRRGEPANVSGLQTQAGKKLCDEFYTLPWFFKLPAPELIGFAYAHHVGWFGQVFEDKYGDEHRLKFVFKSSPNSAVQVPIVNVTFYKEHGVWCFHDIIFDDNKYASALSSAELRDRLMLIRTSSANNLIEAAHEVMVTPPNEFAKLKTAITGVQEMAQFNGFGQRKEVEDFVSVAGELETFAAKWNQTIDAVSSDKFSAQLDASIDAKVHAVYNGTPSGGAEAEAKAEAQIKKDIETTLHKTLVSLNPKDADEYGQHMARLRKAYNAILSLRQN